MSANDLDRYWIDCDHVWRYDVDNPGPDDFPRAVGRLDDGWMLSDALAVASNDYGQWCECDSPECTEAYEDTQS